MMNPKKLRTRILVRAKIFFLSWILQVVFALWVFLLFVLFAKMNRGLSEISFGNANGGGDTMSAMLPATLIAPNPSTE